MDATYIYTCLFFLLALLVARHSKMLGAGVVVAIALSVVYPDIPAGIFLTSAALSVVNLIALTRQ